jgi:hypothetical protein
VKEIDVTSDDTLTISDLDPDVSVDIHLVNDIQNPAPPYYTDRLTMTWDQSSALVLSLIFKTTSGNYYSDRVAWNCGSISPANGFTGNTPSGGRCTNSLIVNSFRLTASDIPIMMRVRPMYSDTSLTVEPSAPGLPVQLVAITSTGEAGEAERTVQARRTHERLPILFDFVAFNGSDTQALDNDASQQPFGVRWFEVISGQVHSNYNGGGNDIDMTGCPSGGSSCVPNTQYVCDGNPGCVFSTRDGSIGITTNRIHTNGGKRWRARSYLTSAGGIDASRYSYNNLWDRMAGEIDADGATLASVSSVLAAGGVARVTATSANPEIIIDETTWPLFGTNPVVVFIGADTYDVKLTFQTATPPFHFTGKNVMFIVSGDVEIKKTVYTVEASVVTDGEIKISNNS